MTTEDYLAKRLGIDANDLSLIAVIQKNQAKPNEPPKLLTYHLMTSSSVMTDDLGNKARHILFDPTDTTILTFLSEAMAQSLIDESWEQQHNPRYPNVTPDLSEHWLSLSHFSQSSEYSIMNPYAHYEVLIQECIDYKGREHGPGTIIGTSLEDPHFGALLGSASHIRIV
mgnify:CR=1 FL=1